jgi:L-asparaginase
MRCLPSVPRRLRRPAAPLLLTALMLALLAPAPTPLHAQGEEETAGDPPRVHVLATGGTISNTQGDRLTGEDLVRSLPGVEASARLTVEQFSNVASGAITLEQWLGMSRRINQLFQEDPDLAGIVVTHGTDTMEETAYFLDLTLAACRPVIVTGAMRRATDLGADGPANLFNAVRVAVHEGARELGAVVLMNDEILPAREVIKVNTSRVDAFEAPGPGRLGVTDPDRVVLERAPRPRTCDAPAFDLHGVEALPRVEVIHSHLGADGTLVRAAVAAGAEGIVVAGVGRGGATPGQSRAVQEARDAGVVVVFSSRTGAGRVPVVRGGGASAEGEEATRGALLGANDLSPQKARILLMLALTRTRELAELREIFETR